MDALLVYKDGRYFRRHVLEGKEVLLGRGGTLVLDSPEVSRRHATLTRSPQGYFLRDMGSSDGTRLNGEPVGPNIDKLIFSGDQIGIGVFTVRCVFAATEEQLRAAELAPLPATAAIEGLDRTSVGMHAPLKRPPQAPVAQPAPVPCPVAQPSPAPSPAPPLPQPAPVPLAPPAPPAPPVVIARNEARLVAPEPPPPPRASPPPPPPPQQTPAQWVAPPPPPAATVPPISAPPLPPQKLHTGTAQFAVRPDLLGLVPPGAAAPPPGATSGSIAFGPQAPTARPTAPPAPAPGAGVTDSSGSLQPEGMGEGFPLPGKSLPLIGPRISTGTQQIRSRPDLLDPSQGSRAVAPPPGAPPSGAMGAIGAVPPGAPPMAPRPVATPLPKPLAQPALPAGAAADGSSTAQMQRLEAPRLQAPSLGRSPEDLEAAALRGSTVPVPAARRSPSIGAAGPQQLYLDTLNIGVDRREGKGVLPEGAETLTVEQWLQFDIFADVQKDRVKKHLERYEDQHPIWVRRYRKGDLIVREGEYGSTAFYILQGKCRIFIAARMGADGKGAAPTPAPEKPAGGFFRTLATFLPGAGKTPRDEAGRGRPRTIPIDATVDLDMAKPVAVLGEGDVFGEMTCMNFYPRSATVRAAEDMVCFEMLRSVLVDLLQRNSRRFKEKLEHAYRTRALDGHLRSVPMFADLPQAFIDHLRSRVELVGPLEPGEVICKEGDAADSFFLVRLGFVKIAQQHPGGELVLAYLGRGQYFGEIGLLEGRPRMATCSALDRVELVKIQRADFDLLVAQNPAIKAKLIAGSAERKDAVRALAERTVSTTVHLDDFIAQGLINAQNVLLIDLDRCTRCDECVRACGEAHGGVSRLIRDGLRFDKYLVTSSCRACTDPVCMVGCPVGSIRRRGSLEIVIEDWCIGCGKCSNQCPYGNINMVDFPAFEEAPSGKKLPLFEPDGKRKLKTQATTCDLSYGREEPACVYACPHEAAMRVEPREFFGL